MTGYKINSGRDRLQEYDHRLLFQICNGIITSFKDFHILIIIMKIVYFRDNSMIFAGINAWVGRIQTRSQLINTGKEGVFLFLTISPGFVKRTPSNDSRMIEIPFYIFAPFI